MMIPIVPRPFSNIIWRFISAALPAAVSVAVPNSVIFAAIVTRLDEDRDITKQAVDLLHSRLSNARKEMVEEKQYDKDLKRIEDSQKSILEAIEKLATSIRHQMNGIQQIVTTQVSLRDQQETRLKLAEDRQTAFINALKPMAVAAIG